MSAYTGDAGPAPSSSPSLVVVSLEPWDDVWRRNQYLTAALLRADPRLRVLFVEPPADVAYAALRRTSPRIGRGLRRGPDLDGTENRLWLYEPTKVLPRRVNPHSDEHRGRRILHAASKAELVNPVLWINDVSGADLLAAGLPALYDVTDDWLAADRPLAERNRLARAEAELLARCDEVTVCSAKLAETKGAGRTTGPDITVITNGVDVGRYRTPAPRPHDLPPGRTAVYVGTLHSDRLDVDLCLATSDALDGDGTLVLVGPVALDAEDSRRLSEAGVVVLGARPFESIPAYLQHADTLVVPHIVDAFTDSLDPIKLYEYLAVGRPVVATAVAGFRDAEPARVDAVCAADFPAVVARVTTAEPRRPALEPPDELPTWTGQAVLMRAALDRAAASRSRR